MGAIKGKGNKTTEGRFRALLIQARIRGWTMQTKALPGKPDFYFPKQQVVVFLDGCFWHGCPRCGHVPSVNRPFWSHKITRNQERDGQKDRQLQERGIRVLRLWEHEVQEEGPACLVRLRTLLGT
jgi:DNA mismatch endonuclease (patch repair protein)